jgi:hypothetical protein
MCECVAELYWQGKAEVLGEQTFPFPHFTPQIPHVLPQLKPKLLSETDDQLREAVLNHYMNFNVCCCPYRTILYAMLHTEIALIHRLGFPVAWP